MQIVHAVWEKENLGVDAYEILLSDQDTPEAVAEEEKRLAAAGAEYIVLKTPVNCSHLLFGLPKLGYTYVETVFKIEVRRSDYRSPDGIARFDRGLTVMHRATPEEWEPVFEKIHSGIFRSDRKCRFRQVCRCAPQLSPQAQKAYRDTAGSGAQVEEMRSFAKMRKGFLHKKLRLAPRAQHILCDQESQSAEILLPCDLLQGDPGGAHPHFLQILFRVRQFLIPTCVEPCAAHPAK